MQHKVVSHGEWVEARKKHLVEEKSFTRLRDQLSQARRDLPWELVAKEYVFEGTQGKRTLDQLFDGRGQLVIYHAMFDPETASEHTTWTTDSPCFACSFWMDNFDRVVVHLNHRDITIAAVSRASVEKIEAYRKRMGWGFPWYSSKGSDFNFAYHVSFKPGDKEGEYNYREEVIGLSEMPGVSVFVREGGKIYHTYSAYARGLDMVNVAYHYMDLVPKGRDENEIGGMAWLHRYDEYLD
jgi:predicted dithiol-disulfide oxidoreductase (DUF899 family)